MKRIIISVLCLAFCVGLSACSGKDTVSSEMSDLKSKAEGTTSKVMSKTESTVDKVTSKVESTAKDVVDGITGDTNVGTTGALKDGEYIVTADEFDSNGYKARVKIEVENGKVEEIECDAIDQNGNERDDDAWEDKMELFEDAVVMRGLDALTFATDGTVEGINGFDLKVSEYKNLIEQALNKAKKTA